MTNINNNHYNYSQNTNILLEKDSNELNKSKQYFHQNYKPNRFQNKQNSIKNEDHKIDDSYSKQKYLGKKREKFFGNFVKSCNNNYQQSQNKHHYQNHYQNQRFKVNEDFNPVKNFVPASINLFKNEENKNNLCKFYDLNMSASSNNVVIEAKYKNNTFIPSFNFSIK